MEFASIFKRPVELAVTGIEPLKRKGRLANTYKLAVNFIRDFRVLLSSISPRRLRTSMNTGSVIAR